MNKIKEITTSELENLIKISSPIILDIRDEDSYLIRHIDQAYNLTSEKAVEQFIQDTDKTAPIIVCCYHGHSSLGFSRYLMSQGFQDVASLHGGFAAWQEKDKKEKTQ